MGSDGRPFFAKDADLTVYWPWVRPCWEEPAGPARPGDQDDTPDAADRRAQ